MTMSATYAALMMIFLSARAIGLKFAALLSECLDVASRAQFHAGECFYDEIHGRFQEIAPGPGYATFVIAEARRHQTVKYGAPHYALRNAR
jgi:hypothetical protein